MKPQHLIVAETFYSIQGEGQTVGIPAVFLRLAGCNLLCNNPFGWRCDTIEVWQKGTSKLFKDVLTMEEVVAMRNGAHLVITGGEPLMHQDAIVDYLNWFRAENFFTPIIEVETNGTIVPNQHLLDKVDYWNCSPKLITSGEPFEKRVNEVALATIRDKGRNHIFKFVITNIEDMFELSEDYGKLELTNIMLMPAGATQEELARTMPFVAELCKTMNFRFSPRLHIDIWNKKTGV